MGNQITIRQHYVSRKYLSSWADEKKQILVDRGNGTFSINPINICVENYFYELSPITEKEKAVILSFFDTLTRQELVSSQCGCNTPHEVIQAFTLLRDNERYPHPILALLDTMIYGCRSLTEVKDVALNKNLEDWLKAGVEEIECLVEGLGYPVIDKILKDDNITDDELTDFIQFVMIQYFRTDVMKTRCKESCGSGINIEKIWPLLHLVLGFNAAVGILNRVNDIIFAKNMTSAHFITSDQPVVNLEMKDGEPTKELNLYYPISPTRAVFITPHMNSKVSGSTCFKQQFIEIKDAAKIEKLNSKIRDIGKVIIQQKV